jgi:tetratricopeptide (TPR) repeat protein
MDVKGLVGSVQVYEVTGAGPARTRLQVAAVRGLTRFVGRHVDLEQLGSVQRLAGRGHGQVVAIVGEAGVGKSRLVREFTHSDYITGWLVLESKSAPYGRASPYLPVIELLRDYFKISADDSTRSINEKVTEGISGLDRSLQDAIPPLLDLLDSLDENHPFRSLDLVQHRQRTYQAVVSLLLSESRVQPVVAVFEELHWNDTLSLGLLNDLVVAAQDSRLLLVVCYRPEYKDQWKNRPNYHQLHLDPLSSESLAEFLQALLGSDSSLDSLKCFLAERANGNPFFVEEIVRTLIDTGVLEGGYRLARPFSITDVPPTVQAVLAARIDALPAADKHLLEEAAVIGPTVPFALLHEVCGLKENELRSRLNNLQAAEFLYATRLFPDVEYTFKHALTHDVAYSGVLHERRREIHARVADAIEALFADRLSEQVERLAHHAVRGGQLEKAVHYLRQAGVKAMGRSALLESRACFEHALDILKLLPESEVTLENAFEIRLELRPVLRQLGEVRQMVDHLREAEALAERLKDDRRRGQVCSFMTTVLSTLNELEEAVLAGTRAVEIAQRRGDLRLGAVATSCLEEAYYYRGEYGHVVNIATASLPALPVEWVGEYFGLAVPASVFGRSWLVMSLAELGRFAEAGKYEAEAIQLAEQTQHAHTIGWAHLAASMLHLLKGDGAKARLLVDHWMAVPGTLDVVMLLPWAVASSAWTLAQAGEAGEALVRVREAERLLEVHAAKEIVGHRSWAYHALSRACLHLGRVDEARRLGSLSVESAQRQPGFKAHALGLLGDLAILPDEFSAERGAAYYRQALALGQMHGMRPLVAHCRLGLGKLYNSIGQAEYALENLTAATMLYREMDIHLLPEAGMMDSGDMSPSVQSDAAMIGPRLGGDSNAG